MLSVLIETRSPRPAAATSAKPRGLRRAARAALAAGIAIVVVWIQPMPSSSAVPERTVAAMTSPSASSIAPDGPWAADESSAGTRPDAVH